MSIKVVKDQDKLIKRYEMDDAEATLAEIYGERFVKYRQDFNRARDYFKHEGEIPEFPLTISFELTNKCNLACIMCYHGTEAAKKEKFVGLSMEDIRQILEESKEKGLPSIILGSGTEFLFAKQAHEVIELVGQSGIMDVFLRTNGILMNEETVDLIFRTNMSRVYISLDAATRETYLAVRRRDALEIIEQNIEHLISERRRRGLKTPIIRLSFVVIDQNRHEQKLFLEKWRDKVDYVDFQLHQDLSHLEDTQTDISNEEIGLPYCSYPFYNLSVLPDGNVAPCCTYYGKDIPVGNIHHQSLEEIWHGDKINEIRKQILTKNFNDVCKRCLFFRDDEFGEEF